LIVASLILTHVFEPPHTGVSLPLTEFNFGDFGGDFGASFGFDADFGAVFGNFPDFFGGSVTSDFEGDSSGSSSDDWSCESLSDDLSGHRRRQRRRRRRRRSNRLFRVESVKNSSWYRNFTAPGETRDLTHELSSSDRFGEFRHYFRMPLSKVEELTEKLISRGYVRLPRTRCRRAEFSERIDAIVDMKDDYVYMPKNITELNRVSSCYGVAGLPGCIGSIDVVHVKG
jgi:hypothetical protein